MQSVKDRINQAVYDILDELETSMDQLDIEKEVDLITDAVYDVLTDLENEGVNLGIGDTIINEDAFSEEDRV